jgi:GTPase
VSVEPADPGTSSLPLVAVVGRPNVGKSTLVNRIFGKRTAIVEERPGVTRDRKEVVSEWRGVPFRLVDTGGWLAGGDALDQKVSRQSEQAIAEADLVIVLIDAVTGVTEEDARAAEAVRRRARGPVLLVVNKVDDASRDALIWEAMSLGLGEPLPVSALHGRNAGDLLDRVVELLPEPAPVEDDDDEVEAATRSGCSPWRWSAGPTWASRPCSTGSSARSGPWSTTCPAPPGTPSTPWSPPRPARSASSTPPACAARRRSTRAPSTTRWSGPCRPSTPPTSPCWSSTPPSGSRPRTSASPSASTPPAARWWCCSTSGSCSTRSSGPTWTGRWRAPALHRRGPRAQDLRPVGQGGPQAPARAGQSLEHYHRRAPTRRVNEVIRAAQQAQPGPHGVKVLYATQAAVDPPTFTLFANREIPKPYLRYLERMLREAFDLGATPLKMRVRRRSG